MINKNQELDIEKLKEFDEEIVTEKELKKLKEMKSQSGFDRIILAKLFLNCFDLFKNNLFLFKEEEKNVKKYLSNFDVAQIRILVMEFGEGGLGTYFKKERISNIVDSKREDFDNLIQTFFKLFGEE